MNTDSVSARVINSCIHYAENWGISVSDIIEANGYAPEVMEDPYSWVGIELFNSILARLRAETIRTDIAYQIGSYSVTSNSWGGVENVILALGNIKPVLLQAARFLGYFFKNISIQTEQENKNIIIKLGNYNNETANEYDFFMGALLSITRLWGDEPVSGIRLSDNSIVISLEGDTPSFFSAPDTFNNYSPSLVDDIIYRLEKNKELIEKKNAQLKTNNKELKDAYRKLEQSTLEKIQSEKLATIGTLASGIAHEINNPLSFIISNFRTMKNYLGKINGIIPFDGNLKHIFEDMPNLITETEEGLQRVKKLVEDINYLAHPGHEEKIESKLEDIIKTAISVTQNLHKKDIQISESYGHKTMIECVPSRISQVFLNILINSIHAIKDKNIKGIIEIKTKEKGKNITVEIKDNGVGIPKENLSQIFNPFFTTKRPGLGTGLGLSTVLTIIKAHDGSIDIQSEEDTGTTVTIVLPI